MNIEEKVLEKLKKLSVRELTAIARSNKLKGYSKLKREALQEKLINEIGIKKLHKELFPTFIEKRRSKISFWITIICLILAIVPFFISKQTEFKNSSKTRNYISPKKAKPFKILLISLFADIDNEKLNVSYEKQIQERFDNKNLNEGLNIRVTLSEKIPENHVNDEYARVEGVRESADMVIWGSYEEDNSGMSGIRIRYLLTKEKNFEENNLTGDTGMQPIENLSQLRNGYLQKNIDYIVYCIEGFNAYHKRDYDKAVSMFSKAEKLINNPEKSIESSRMLGTLYYNIGSYDISFKYLNTALSLQQKSNSSHSKLVDTYILLARICYRKLYFQESLNHMNEALKLYELNNLQEKDNLKEIYKYQSLAYSRLNRYERALKLQHEVVSIQKEIDSISYEMMLAYRSLAYKYKLLKKYNEAILYYEKVIKLSPDVRHGRGVLASVYNDLGILYADNKDYQKALTSYSQGLKLNDYNTNVINNNIGYLYIRKKDYQQALKYLERSLSDLNPRKFKSISNSIILYLNFSYAYLKLDDCKNAKTYLDLIESLIEESNYQGPLKANFYFNHAMFKFNTSEFKKAKELIDKSISLYKQEDDNSSASLQDAIEFRGKIEKFL